jgi:hypothetical protein
LFNFLIWQVLASGLAGVGLFFDIITIYPWMLRPESLARFHISAKKGVRLVTAHTPFFVSRKTHP